MQDNPSNGGLPPGIIARQLAQAYAGRNQGPEFFQSLNHTGAVQQMVFRNMTINRPLEAILIRWTGRIAITVADYTAMAAEALQSILQRIQVTGTYKGSALTPFDISGATAFAFPSCFVDRGNSAYINDVLQAPLTSPVAQQVANFGAIGTYDVDLWFALPMYPWLPLGSRSNAEAAQNYVPYLWQPQDWGDTIQITLDLGDRTAFGTPAGGTVVTFTGFGSAAGQPSVEVYTRYAVLGEIRSGFRTAVCVRNEQLSQAAVAAAANNLRLAQLIKRKTTNIVVKSGLALAGTTAGVFVYSALSDRMLDRTVILVDNKFLRNNRSNLASKESVGQTFGAGSPQGYLPFSFIDSGTPRTCLRADLPSVVGAAATFELQTDVVTANAQNRVQIVQEQIVADVDDPYWGGTR